MFDFRYRKQLGENPDTGAQFPLLRDDAFEPVSAVYQRESLPAVFLERDGVINHLVATSRKASGVDVPISVVEFTLIDGVRDSLCVLGQLGLMIFVVSNQPDFAKGKMSLAIIQDITQRMFQLVAHPDCLVPITEVYYCPHYPHSTKQHMRNCDCRKPKPGLFLRAAADWNIDLSRSISIGDRDKDTQAAINAGIERIIQLDFPGDPHTLAGAVPVIMQHFGF